MKQQLSISSHFLTEGKKNPHLFNLNIAECHFECG